MEKPDYKKKKILREALKLDAREPIFKVKNSLLD